MLAGLRRIVLWDFPRATWQYDVIVAAILIFIFFTPRSWFRDQPRTPQTSATLLVPGSYWLEPELLTGTPEEQRPARATSILEAKYKKHNPVNQLQPIYDSEHELKGFVAFTRP